MKIRLAILYGGRSAEHQISVVSARSVMEALDPERFEAVPIGITQQGAWLLPARSPLELTAPAGGLPEVEPVGAEVALHPEQRASALTVPGGSPAAIGQVDVVFPVLHGPYGEDGTVQGMLEVLDVPYVGAGVAASAVCMDKVVFKELMAVADIPQVDYAAVREGDDPATLERLGLPVFVKPARL
ncbi:MAG TPA: D-alanine--D-alanine ligase A, partial [Actinomycetes bacterium]